MASSFCGSNPDVLQHPANLQGSQTCSCLAANRTSANQIPLHLLQQTLDIFSGGRSYKAIQSWWANLETRIVLHQFAFSQPLLILVWLVSFPQSVVKTFQWKEPRNFINFIHHFGAQISCLRQRPAADHTYAKNSEQAQRTIKAIRIWIKISDLDAITQKRPAPQLSTAEVGMQDVHTHIDVKPYAPQNKIAVDLKKEAVVNMVWQLPYMP